MEMSVSKSNCWKEVEDYKKIFSSIFLESRQILGMVGIYISEHPWTLLKLPVEQH